MSSLIEYGWHDAVAGRITQLERVEHSDPTTVPGRVVRVDRGRVVVATASSMVACHPGASPHLPDPAAGDWVLVRGDDRTGRAVVGVTERTSAIVRRDPTPGDNRDHVLAANVDFGLILYRLDRKVRLSVLERYMVLIWDGGAAPLIVFSKADLVDQATVADALQTAASGAPGVDAVAVSAMAGDGISELRSTLAGPVTAALFGESGVGKSTLINALVGHDLLETGETRRSDGRGRHTTTARHLVPIGGGTVVVDTPGLRSVGLLESAEGMGRVFGDVEELIAQCRFNDCHHETEPGCAILAAIADGTLEQRRWDSYLKLAREQERIARRKASIARRAERKEIARRRAKSRRRSREP